MDLHPALNTARVPRAPPLLKVEDHDAGVEVAWPPSGKRSGKHRIRPEPLSEILSEISVAVLRRANRPPSQVRSPKLGYVVDDDKVRIEIYDAADAGLEHVGKVVPRVVQRLLERLPHGGGDQSSNSLRIEVVYFKSEARERGTHQGFEASVGDEEMEEDIFRAECVLQHRMDSGDRPAEILFVERNCDVYQRRVARLRIDSRNLAFCGIVEWQGLAKGKSGSVGARRGNLAGESEIAIEMRGSDGLRRRERLQGR